MMIFENNLNLQYLDRYIDNIPNIYLENFINGIRILFDLSEDNLLKRIEDPKKSYLIKDSFDLYSNFFERLI